MTRNVTEDNVSFSGPQTFTIPKSHTASLFTIVQKANRRLARAGAAERFEYQQEDRIIEDVDNPGSYREVSDIILNTPTISAEGYTFLAVIVKEENGFVVRSATNVELDGWRPDGMLCEHCGTRRSRSKTYLVSTPEGVNMQVGSSCLQPLLGLTPAGLWALIWDIDLSKLGGGSGFGSEDTRIPLDYVIAMALGISQMGENYVTRSAVENGYSGLSTTDSVKDALFGTEAKRQAERADQAATAVQLLKDEADAIKDIIAGAQYAAPSTDYQTNMNVIMSSEWVTPRNVGYAVSAVGTWVRNRRAAAVAQQVQANPAASGYVAPEGTKLRGLDVTVTSITNFPGTDYMGYPITKSRVNLRDIAGHEIIWWASRVVDEVTEGDNAVITSATVKKHDTYKGTDQTHLNRVRLQTV